MKLTTISVFLLACLSLKAAVNTQYLQGLTSPVQANIDSRVLKAGDTMTGPLVIGGGTVTASTPVLNLTQTWNNGAVVFTGIKLNVTPTAQAAGSRFIDFQSSSVSVFHVSSGGTVTANGNAIFSGSLYLGSTATSILVGSAANILDLRNSTNAQTFQVYGTYTDASNYRRLRSTMTIGGAVTISAEGLGTGASGNTLTFQINGLNAISISAANIATFGSSIQTASTGSLFFGSRSVIDSSADGLLLLHNFGTTDADFFLKLGVNTSAAAGIKRVGTSLRTQLNDDSGYAAHHSLYDRFGSGTPEGSQTAPVGATYHRTDGGAGTSFYVKESGSGNTGWVAK